jgi:molecular chaperone IbpA
MSSHDLDRLFNRFNELAVGFGPIFKDFTHTSNNYPPHNIVSISDSKFNLELAVAGFKKSEITISEDAGLLTITGDKKDLTETSVYQFKGIANRSFSKSFRIAEYFEIREAGLEDGILTISFVKNEPLSQSKLIPIK